jgi:hypothetical protein
MLVIVRSSKINLEEEVECVLCIKKEFPSS